MTKSAKFDPVERPAHYCRGGLECRDAIQRWGLHHYAFRADVLEYIVRAGHKPEGDKAKEIQDLRKALECLKRDIKVAEEELASTPQPNDDGIPVIYDEWNTPLGTNCTMPEMRRRKGSLGRSGRRKEG